MLDVIDCPEVVVIQWSSHEVVPYKNYYGMYKYKKYDCTYRSVIITNR